MFETKDAKNRENTKKYKSNIEEHKSFRLGNQEGVIFFLSLYPQSYWSWVGKNYGIYSRIVILYRYRTNDLIVQLLSMQ